MGENGCPRFCESVSALDGKHCLRGSNARTTVHVNRIYIPFSNIAASLLSRRRLCDEWGQWRLGFNHEFKYRYV